jgi:hypothetical protein
LSVFSLFSHDLCVTTRWRVALSSATTPDAAASASFTTLNLNQRASLLLFPRSLISISFCSPFFKAYRKDQLAVRFFVELRLQSLSCSKVILSALQHSRSPILQTFLFPQTVALTLLSCNGMNNTSKNGPRGTGRYCGPRQKLHQQIAKHVEK